MVRRTGSLWLSRPSQLGHLVGSASVRRLRRAVWLNERLSLA